MEEFVNDEAVLKYKSLVGKAKEIARRTGRREGIEEGRKEGLHKGIQKGIQEGIQEGTKLEKCNIAKNLLSLNIDIPTIMKSTGLSKKEIQKLEES